MTEAAARSAYGQDMKTLYTWLNIPRFVIPVLSALLVSILWAYGLTPFDPRPVVFGLIPFVLAVSAGWGILIRKGYFPEKLLIPQLILDLLMVTVGVYLTGGLHSEFIFIYVFVVVSATLVSFRATAVVGIGAIALYLMLGLITGFARADIIRIAIFILVVGLISFQSLFYVSQIRRKNLEILKFKDEFLFRTIHDLRSPSTVLRLILDKYADPVETAKLPESVRQDVDLLQKVSLRMRSLVEDILKIAKGEQGELEFKKERLDAAAVLRYCLEELGPLIKERNIAVSYVPRAGLPAVLGDEEKLKEVFNNFLSNAIKYNKESGMIKVSQWQEGKNLVTVIKDTGIGISKENLQKLFTAYFRGDVDRSIEGTGLGLYFKKKLVEKMDGKIEVDSSPGQGTTFTISLPLADK